MAFKLIEASNVLELETKLNDWETDNAGATINDIRFTSFGTPQFLASAIPSLTKEKHVVCIYYTPSA